MRFDVSPGLAARYGLSWEACQGVPFGEHDWQRERYVIGAPGPAAPEDIRSLHIQRWHNFGNMVFQLSHALAFAERHEIGVISGPDNSWFAPGETAGIKLVFGRRAAPPRLLGNFFYPFPLGLEAPFRQSRHLEALRRLFVLADEPARSDHDLVIHLRSGDVFGDDPHPAYWPPALDYYLAAIRASGAASVLVVSQDFDNPLLEPLRRWCTESRIRLEVQASDLRQDLLALVSARRLCLSQGTMGMASAWLSSTVRTVYIPHAQDAREMVDLGIEVHATAEAPDPEQGSWHASPEQVAGLLTEQDTRFHPLR